MGCSLPAVDGIRPAPRGYPRARLPKQYIPNRAAMSTVAPAAAPPAIATAFVLLGAAVPIIVGDALTSIR